MEIESAARWEALQDQTIAGLVGPRVYRHRLWERVQGTGKQALVVRRADGWSRPRPGSGVEFPVLVFECYADPSRDPSGKVLREDAPDKAWSLYRAVNERFHARKDEWWGARGVSRGLRIHVVDRYVEPALVTRDDVHLDEKAWLQDMVRVEARYAVETAH